MNQTTIPAPRVSTALWRPLYEAANKFAEFQAWRDISDMVLFALKDPVTGDIGYCNIMGKLGEFFAFAIYRGESGLECLMKVSMGEYQNIEHEFVQVSDTLMAEFCSKEGLEKEDLVIMKKLGIKMNDLGLFPCFRSAPKGSFPWFVTKNEVRYLTFALQCACDAVEQYRKDPSVFFLNNPCRFRLYTPVKSLLKGTSWKIETHFSEPSFEDDEVVDSFRLDKRRIRNIVKANREKKGVWEVSTVFFPGSVHDRERPYSPRVALMVDRDSFYVLGTKIVLPEDNYHHKICEKLLEIFEGAPHLPTQLVFSDAVTCETAEPLAEALGLEVAVEANLPAIKDVSKSMIEAFINGPKF
ncbi:Uncharacterized protein SCG7086_AJ_00090 [Chlamydiales bacterium SCGC AG-110-P3]|nr:Uncharacterized protein SCG7086_AJ_00090 [Chlamydiales bacterium SCGC AG-110-P3]